ncbi:type I restriction enzyme endonuclease domain-containing protein [Micromonospora sp. SD19]
MRRLIERKAREFAKHNVVRQERFSAQLEDLLNRYMLQQVTRAQLIVELESAAARRKPAARPRSTTPSWPSTAPSDCGRFWRLSNVVFMVIRPALGVSLSDKSFKITKLRRS